MANKIIKGDELMMFKDGVSIALATSHTLTLTGDVTEENDKDHGQFSGKAVNKISWEVTAEHLYSELGFMDLFNLMVRKTQFYIVLAQPEQYDKNGLGTRSNWKQNDSTNYYKGTVIISSLNLNANTGDIATFSVTLTGVGSLVRNLATTIETHNDEVLLSLLHRANLISSKSYATLDEYKAIDNAGFANALEYGNLLTDFNEFQYFTSVTQIPEGLFEQFTNLISITMPESLQYISRYAFRYCSNLEFVKLNEGLISIGDAAFRMCNLSSITIPDSVVSIRYSAFSGMSNLTKVVFESSDPPAFGTYVFDNNENLVIEVPKGSVDDYTEALTGKFGDGNEIKFKIQESK